MKHWRVDVYRKGRVDTVKVDTEEFDLKLSAWWFKHRRTEEANCFSYFCVITNQGAELDNQAEPTNPGD